MGIVVAAFPGVSSLNISSHLLNAGYNQVTMRGLRTICACLPSLVRFEADENFIRDE